MSRTSRTTTSTTLKVHFGKRLRPGVYRAIVFNGAVRVTSKIVRVR
ncbi:MAG: hypothetical protein ACEQSX_16580 [Baekduiaceae bacterium]